MERTLVSFMIRKKIASTNVGLKNNNLNGDYNFAASHTPKVSIFCPRLPYEQDTQVSFDSPVLNNRGVGVSKGGCRMERAGGREKKGKKRQPSIKCGRVNREQGGHLISWSNRCWPSGRLVLERERSKNGKLMQ